MQADLNFIRAVFFVLPSKIYCKCTHEIYIRHRQISNLLHKLIHLYNRSLSSLTTCGLCIFLMQVAAHYPV